MLPQTESITILRETHKLDQISKNSSEPICITKNGEEYLYILNPILFRQLIDELEYEKEMNFVLSRVQQSKADIEENRVLEFENFIKRKKNELV